MFKVKYKIVLLVIGVVALLGAALYYSGAMILPDFTGAAGIAASALAAILISWLVIKKLLSPLEQILGGARALKYGNYEVGFDIKTKDEFAEIAGEFSDALTKLEKEKVTAIKKSEQLEVQFRDASLRVTSSSTEILTVSQNQAAGSREQSAAVAETTAAATELSKSAEQIGENIRKVTEAANHALIGMAKIREAIMRTSDRVTSLGEKSQKIGKIAEVIDDVADQTNLLAVNAAIEAARAGEQGRGFTVVADEMRKLADSTAKSTKDITALIEIIQHEISDAIIQMDQCRTGVDDEVRLTKESAEKAKEISMSTNQQVSGSKQIAIAMNNINEGMKQINSGAEKSQEVAEQLTTLADELKEMMIRVKMGEAQNKK